MKTSRGVSRFSRGRCQRRTKTAEEWSGADDAGTKTTKYADAQQPLKRKATRQADWPCSGKSVAQSGTVLRQDGDQE
ncbi:hypothetical protein NDU88_002373 [Pleurodeles waltl]|uniref:Uncharacterized protein n=1 Tax=Pleurodeles waltl TaxID=8319 RepID=A0AAV7TLF8_PLEWA|nr:hypothetical protein NDU88_002373 [Pleurodeles waltl]